MEQHKDAENAEVQEIGQFKWIVRAFKAYKSHALQRINVRQKYVKTMTEKHQMLLKSYMKHLEQQKVCVEHNAEFIKLIIRDFETRFENMHHDDINTENVTPSEMAADIDLVQSILRQFYRDWSSSGEQERQQCYAPIINQIEHLFPDFKSKPRDSVEILVPGAGLGRLGYEIAKRGFCCQGNEFSPFMLFASNFILNKCANGVNKLPVFPWVHTSSNTLKNQDILRSAFIPDVDPSDLPENSQFTMAAGDFLEIYTEQDKWDCIASCFFIDCANNIVAFIEAIYNILKPGGYWVNLGPLMYHIANHVDDGELFSDPVDKMSIEPSYEEVKSIITGIGFKFVVEDTGIQTTYTLDVNSLLKYEFDSVFFVVQKPL